MQGNILFTDHPARCTDPVTSSIAADKITRSGVRGRQAAQVLDALRAYGLPVTSAELAVLADLDRYMVARRLPDLERQGHVTRMDYDTCSVTGHKAVLWRVT